ncbi:methyltransferase domain-containing protein [Streptomyces sp. NPDC091281]|uniref:methyltransferase domain-containing protein n=1 Tax=Streptomyces sp. NPDC091281 TaxID=3365985 RepID=UPI0038108B16
MKLTGVEEGRSALGRSLLEHQDLSADWVPSFVAVPRAAFLPDLMWPHDMETGDAVAVDRRQEPALWQGYADADVPIVTQWDDGVGDGPGVVPTSSASMPSIVFRMLRDLRVEAGHRVLEIGTGTGWNAALLAHRLGSENMVSIEIDPQVAEVARQRLAAFGALGHVLTRDGTEGDASGAPYDRVIVTAGVRRIPPAWLEQTSSDGLIVVPWGTHLSNEDAILRLKVDHGGASGRFTSPCEFMKVRSQRLAFDGHRSYVPGGVADADRATAAVSEEQLLGKGHFDARTFAIGLRVRDCYRIVAPARDGTRPVWFYGLTDRSWSCVMLRSDAEAVVYQAGPRRLWDEVSDALRWWKAAGAPGHDRFGLTVTATGEHLAWLDSPDESWPV